MADDYDDLIKMGKELVNVFQKNAGELKGVGEMTAISLAGKKTPAQIMEFQIGWRSSLEALDEVISDMRGVTYKARPFGKKAQDDHTNTVLAYAIGIMVVELAMSETAHELTGIKGVDTNELMGQLRKLDKDIELLCRQKTAEVKRMLKEPLK